ncbi:SDR family oxidoreductase [Dyella nitratireducens]|uniref:Short-chain dehydrogenase/reductase n=1 Tax=Dyella nitratireducens TaxID=1849580 RepID=A0ABQ1G9J0_9GAMM|nr:SDR family oxidoreductase [Dyella nitratireducens]GGA39332.1 short-chain dehydrogenase/reductase [Dyella nitratireducens]GLQ40431.1 short-chain dehydrogenase/reductase [Dyella nitratireducens]
MKKTIFITGASTGLGRATALLFASRGYHVIATMRKPTDDTWANTPNITLLPLDVTDRAQIEATASKAIELGGIDILFNNAGSGIAGPLEGTTDEQLTRHVETNLLGAIRTTQAFLPHFREKRSGTILTTTSIAGLTAQPFDTLYHATKWALEGWTESLSLELSPFGIAVKSIAPGSIKTDFMSHMVVSTHLAYDAMVQKAFALFSSPEYQAGSSTAEQIAEVAYEAATDGKDQLRYIAGADAKEAYAHRVQLGAEKARIATRELFFGK